MYSSTPARPSACTHFFFPPFSMHWLISSPLTADTNQRDGGRTVDECRFGNAVGKVCDGNDINGVNVWRTTLEECFIVIYSIKHVRARKDPAD